MEINKVTKIYFSPTNSTNKVIDAIEEGLGVDRIESINLTNFEVRTNFRLDITSKDELLIIGVPVYAQRIPQIIKDPLSRLKGSGQPVILISLCGGIGKGIALKQLEEILGKSGFNMLAAGAFIGEHSFSSNMLEIEKNRPDKDDLQLANKFGKSIIDKLKKMDSIEDFNNLNIKGKLTCMPRIVPQNNAKWFVHNPEIDSKKCNRCGICANLCPTNAINRNDFSIDDELCLRCFACVKSCPAGAREITYKFAWIVKLYLKIKSRRRMLPDIYI